VRSRDFASISLTQQPDPLSRRPEPLPAIVADFLDEAARIADGFRSQSAVLPSMSVKRKVTVPEGRSAIARSIGVRRELLGELHPIVASRWEV
jgi:hypothetical protein